MIHIQDRPNATSSLKSVITNLSCPIRFIWFSYFVWLHLTLYSILQLWNFLRFTCFDVMWSSATRTRYLLLLHYYSTYWWTVKITKNGLLPYGLLLINPVCLSIQWDIGLFFIEHTERIHVHTRSCVCHIGPFHLFSLSSLIFLQRSECVGAARNLWLLLSYITLFVSSNNTRQQISTFFCYRHEIYWFILNWWCWFQIWCLNFSITSRFCVT